MKHLKCRVWSGTMFLDGGDANIHVVNRDDTKIEIVAAVPHKEYEISLWTGLLDRNSKEIYEGDVLSLSGVNKWKVRDLIQDGIDSEKLEIIGNIYENPKLLK